MGIRPMGLRIITTFDSSVARAWSAQCARNQRLGLKMEAVFSLLGVVNSVCLKVTSFVKLTSFEVKPVKAIHLHRYAYTRIF